MKRKIFRLSFLSCVVTALLTSLLIELVLFGSITDSMEQDVKQAGFEYRDVLNETEMLGAEFLASVPHGNLRVTLITSAGEIAFDNRSDTTENHANRPEFIQAVETGIGSSTRFSDTIGQQTFYYAILLDDGNVIRVSRTIDSVFTIVVGSLPYVLLGILAVLVASILISKKFTSFVVDPINTIDVENPLKAKAYEELSPLLLRIDSQTVKLKSQMSDLEKMRNELSDIMEQMEEGLIVLNSTGKVISINNAAADILNCKKDISVGRYMLELNRDEVFQKINKAVNDKTNFQTEFTKGESIYNISVSNIKSGGSILMFVNVTERYMAEKMRKEFSANVSHELKTPLQTITGSAELLKNNMVKQEDIPQFIERIHSEGLRMTSLIQDIIKLSHLDENASGIQKETVDIFEIVSDCELEYKQKASEKNISFAVSGESCLILGTKLVLKECIYNIVDNAIKYTNSGGSVDVSVTKNEQFVKLSVKDSGIGIPKEEQTRVFERFYRVEKSRCRDKGGTGLGLSIVKHAVLIHGGEISLESEEQKGTTITISFPKV